MTIAFVFKSGFHACGPIRILPIRLRFGIIVSQSALPNKSCQATKSGSGLTLQSQAFVHAKDFLGKAFLSLNI